LYCYFHKHKKSPDGTSGLIGLSVFKFTLEQSCLPLIKEESKKDVPVINVLSHYEMLSIANVEKILSVTIQ